jgi:hypothetical protein
MSSRSIAMLAPRARLAVRASLDLYSRILDNIERNGYDNFSKRAYTTKLEKLSVLPAALAAAALSRAPPRAGAPASVKDYSKAGSLQRFEGIDSFNSFGSSGLASEGFGSSSSATNSSSASSSADSTASSSSAAF